MENKIEKTAAFNEWLMKYEAPELRELSITTSVIVAGASTDEGPDDNDTGENETDF